MIAPALQTEGKALQKGPAGGNGVTNRPSTVSISIGSWSLTSGAQYAQLIARRVREAHVFLRDHSPRDATAAEAAALNPTAVILSGGPASVYAERRVRHRSRVLRAGRADVLGICYGHQLLIAHRLGGVVDRREAGEYGKAELETTDEPSILFAELPEQQPVWMSHGDAVVKAPPGFSL